LYSENPLYENPPPESLLTTTSTNESSFDTMNAAPISGGATNNTNSSVYGDGDILSAVLHCQHTVVSSLAW